jgi:hypothetical protein
MGGDRDRYLYVHDVTLQPLWCASGRDAAEPRVCQSHDAARAESSGQKGSPIHKNPYFWIMLAKLVHNLDVGM